MRKQILTALSLCALLTTSLAADSCSINSGAYAGVGVGMAHLGGKMEFQNSLAGAGGGVQEQSNFPLSQTSAAAALFGGYGMRFGGFWTAGELFYQFDNLKNTENFIAATNPGKSLKSSSTGAYGAAVHLGYAANNNCIAYVILGVEARRFKVQFADSRNNIVPTISKNIQSVAFAPGVGVRVALCKNLGFRVEYKYAAHPKKKISSSAFNAASAANETVNVQHKPSVQSINLGVVYSF